MRKPLMAMIAAIQIGKRRRHHIRDFIQTEPRRIQFAQCAAVFTEKGREIEERGKREEERRKEARGKRQVGRVGGLRSPSHISFNALCHCISVGLFNGIVRNLIGSCRVYHLSCCNRSIYSVRLSGPRTPSGDLRNTFILRVEIFSLGFSVSNTIKCLGC